MTKKDPYKLGIDHGVRYAVTWLHERARSMKDPKAREVLNSAAFNLGVEYAMGNKIIRPEIFDDVPEGKDLGGD